MDRYSERCPDLKTRWDGKKQTCVNCTTKPGEEITPNCGYDDIGGQHDTPTKPCNANTFNNGSFLYCQPCTKCPPGFDTAVPCSPTADTQCHDPRTTEVPRTTQTTPRSILTKGMTQAPLFQTAPTASTTQPWRVPLFVFISATIVVLFAIFFYMKGKKDQHLQRRHTRRLSHVNKGFAELSSPPDNDDLEDTLSSKIQSAPLQTVLDNLDVLEELVILLDPESPSVKNTRHLASHCSFPSTWITYTYSMKESRSPLRAVLEGVACRNPEWTVGDLAKALRHLGRNDAVAVLGKLEPSKMDAPAPNV